MILLYQPFQKTHYPSLSTKLASLVKGRWLDGTTQTVALLRPACDMSAHFILQTFLPSRRRDCLSCTDPLHPHNHCKRTTHPCSALNSPSLSKVRYCRPKKFGRLPKGLLYTHQPLHLHNHFKRTIIPRSTSVLLYNTSITQKSVHRLIRQPLEQLHRKTGAKRRNNSTLPCSHYRKIKKQQ